MACKFQIVEGADFKPGDRIRACFDTHYPDTLHLFVFAEDGIRDYAIAKRVHDHDEVGQEVIDTAFQGRQHRHDYLEFQTKIRFCRRRHPGLRHRKACP